jgi:hypothetical protein
MRLSLSQARIIPGTLDLATIMASKCANTTRDSEGREHINHRRGSAPATTRSARRGYVTGTVESFTGAFSGTKYSYEYVSAGKAMATVIYYLRVTKRAIYRIEFTGLPKMLLDLADQTDCIARSFRLK